METDRTHRDAGPSPLAETSEWGSTEECPYASGSGPSEQGMCSETGPPSQVPGEGTGPLYYFRRIDVGYFPVRYRSRSGHPDICDLAGSRAVDDRLERVVDVCQGRRRTVEDDEIGLLGGFDGAEFVIEAKRSGALYGGHRECVPG